MTNFIVPLETNDLSPTRKLLNLTNHTTTTTQTSDTMVGEDRSPIGKKPDASTKPKVVLFYKNGDRNFRGHHVTVTPRRFRSFDGLLSELTRITNLAQGARCVFTPVNGTPVDSLNQLEVHTWLTSLVYLPLAICHSPPPPSPIFTRFDPVRS